MAESLADRHVGVLQRLTNRQIFFPGVRNAETKLFENIRPVDNGVADIEERDTAHRAVDRDCARCPAVKVVTAQFGKEITMIPQPASVEMRLIHVHLYDIGAAATFDRSGDACRHVVLIDELDRDVDPSGLGELLRLTADLDISIGNEARPLQVVQLSGLRDRRGLSAEERRRGEGRARQCSTLRELTARQTFSSLHRYGCVGFLHSFQLPDVGHP